MIQIKAKQSWYSTQVANNRRAMRACIIGSGPAGFYSAYRLLSNLPDCTIDIFEALPVPYGLARFGVAPDHPEVKNVTHKFDEVASSPRVKFYGNVKIGQDISLRKLEQAYDCILFAHGASLNRNLGIPGEDLPGVLSARSFVGWYNGLPEAVALQPRLDECETAVIIGQGNVALDIARTLLSSVDELRNTDIADYALDQLSRSRVKRVNIIGRRGPLEASFTIKEVRELINLPGVCFDTSNFPYYKELASLTLPRAQKRLIDLLAKQNSVAQPSDRSWHIQYKLSPLEFQGSAKLESILFAQNKLEDFGGHVRARSTGETTTQDAEMAFLSIGYQSEAISGMEDIGVIFDTTKHIVPNERGRVTTMDGFVPGMYCSGWAKVGPVGVIASTMRDAFETADLIAQDWTDPTRRDKVLGLDSADLMKEVAKNKQVITWDRWQVLQKHEIEAGQHDTPARPARKVTNLDEMIRVATTN